MSSTNEDLPPKPRASPLDFRNTDLVSRLLAATPPYLYNMPLVPNSYFFSEMLRSLVQAKTEARTNPPSNPHQHPHRRSRKRSWTQARSDCHKPADWQTPLELTAGKVAPANPVEEVKAAKSNAEVKHSVPSMVYPTPVAQNAQQDGLIMPPPPIWYPSLYPSPYGIDPLHFFIDLRVSGHVYDRKNQKEPPRVSEAEGSQGFRQTRHASAFTVPIPGSPMNLSSEKGTKFDVKSLGFDKSYGKTSTNYIMGNIGSIYKRVSQDGSLKSESEEVQVVEPAKEEEEETEEEKQKRVKDLRALIGLELVVDYMNHAKPQQPPENFEDSSGDAESTASSAVEVVSVEEGNPDVLSY